LDFPSRELISNSIIEEFLQEAFPICFWQGKDDTILEERKDILAEL
jgi:hypothetical protein